MFFFLYSQLSPAHRRLKYIDQSILPKKMTFPYIFKEKEKVISFSGSFSTFQFFIFSPFFENILKHKFFGKIYWSMNSGRRWAGDNQGYKKKNNFHFQNSTKMVTKCGKFKKLKSREGSQLCKLSQLCYHFLRVLKMKIFFFLYPQLSPAHRGPEFIDQSIFPKKLTILYIFNTKKSAKLKRREGSRYPSLLFSFALFFFFC